ncbi:MULTISPECIES: BON domain-containing protein [unclassified Phenylobacterium]|uniref:BON domain-containing protein n=1 Tax=unclassified Phenylobacterium TaxID=2640670 RepID=UPI00083A92E8|nr:MULTISPECIES: BON domain-containing protein [unclassified Phenylobacterium]
MKSDEDIRHDVEAELQWDPDIRAADIAVAVKEGVVTLTGFVRSYAQRWQAERDAKRVSGVRGVANDIEVRLPNLDARPDPEIARDAVQEIRFTLPYSGEKITVTVKSGWVTLEGEVEWHYLRERAEEAVRRVRGVKGVTNLIAIKAKVATTVVKSQIEDALRRSAETDAKTITVEVDGDKVILRGQVRSWAERQDAERAAWRAPGVREVQNLIAIKV